MAIFIPLLKEIPRRERHLDKEGAGTSAEDTILRCGFRIQWFRDLPLVNHEPIYHLLPGLLLSRCGNKDLRLLLAERNGARQRLHHLPSMIFRRPPDVGMASSLDAQSTSDFKSNPLAIRNRSD